MSFNLPVEIISVLLPFADLFSKKVWNHVQIMLVGSILATGKRTVTSILEVMGLAAQPNFRSLSSSIKSCSLVKPPSKQDTTNNFSHGIYSQGNNCLRDRRYDRTTKRNGRHKLRGKPTQTRPQED